MARRRQQERPKLRIVGEYIEVDGQKIEVNPIEVPGLAARCKVAWAEITTGQRWKVVKAEASGQ